MSRWNAAAIHLSISIVIGIAAATLIFGVWYPPPYSQAAGATKLILLLLGVDLVLGPLLTLVIFKSGKKSLKLDLSVIAALQACAFFYGMSVVTQARPAFLVAAVDRFVLVAANDLDPEDLAQASSPKYRTLSWAGPQVVGAIKPTDAEDRSNLVFSGAAGKDIEKFPKYYADYAQVAPSLLERSQSLDTLIGRHPTTKVVDVWLRHHQREASTTRWLPMVSKRASMTVLVDASSGKLLDILPIDP